MARWGLGNHRFPSLEFADRGVESRARGPARPEELAPRRLESDRERWLSWKGDFPSGNNRLSEVPRRAAASAAGSSAVHGISFVLPAEL